MERPALLVVDMQHDFLDPESPCYAPGSEEIIPRIARLITVARSRSVPVVFTQEAHRPGRIDSGRELDPGTGASYPGGDESSPVPEHCVEGTPGIEIIDDLEPRPDDPRIAKRRYSCFLGTDLDLLLRNLEADTLFVTGVDSNVCVLWTVGDAFQRDYHVRVVSDCVAGTSPEEHEAALLIMGHLVGGLVKSDEVIETLEADFSAVA